MRIEFTVKDRPPKKHGEKSMWDHDIEAPRIVPLRKKALEARNEAGLEDCFHSPVELEVTIYVPESKLESIGDLDNFITGICDGLQNAHHRVDPHDVFKDPDCEDIEPRRALLIEDDSQVVKINAEKKALPENEYTYYEVVIEPNRENSKSQTINRHKRT